MSADDLKARLRRFATDLGSEMIFTAADRIEELETKNANLFDLAAEEHTRANGLEYALTQSRAAQASLIEARDEMEKCWKEEKSRADNSEAALTQSQAEVAAAYERAADSVRRLEDGWHDGVSAEYHQHSSAQMKLYAIREIRALATPDQTSALDTIRAEAREQGMREAAAIALQRKGDGVATLDHPYDKGYLAACDAIAKSILVAITKGAKA